MVNRQPGLVWANGCRNLSFMFDQSEERFTIKNEDIMKYLCLVYGEEGKIAAMDDDACMAYDAAIRESGQCIASEALQSVRTATTVRVRNGKIAITDGPFAETKEQLAGFYLVDAQDLDEAIQIAAKIPPAEVGCIEVRPVRQLVSTSGVKRVVQERVDTR